MKLFAKMKNRISGIRVGIEQDRDKVQKEGGLFRMVLHWIFKLRSIFLAIPVIFATVIMAINNSVRLPETVSLCVPSFAGGTMAIEIVEISKTFAVFGPIAITALCLVLMFVSRRVAYPWLISVFSLVLPWFMFFASVFPG